jgi:hypothetical protein
MALFLLFLFRFSIDLGWMQTPQDLSPCQQSLLDFVSFESQMPPINKITSCFLVNNKHPWGSFQIF